MACSVNRTSHGFNYRISIICHDSSGASLHNNWLVSLRLFEVMGLAATRAGGNFRIMFGHLVQKF